MLFMIQYVCIFTYKIKQLTPLHSSTEFQVFLGVLYKWLYVIKGFKKATQGRVRSIRFPIPGGGSVGFPIIK